MSIPNAPVIAKGTWGRLVEIVPSVKISFLELLADEIAKWNARVAEDIAGSTIHGARMAGEVLTLAEEEAAPGQWVLVGLEPDGRNCEDCLDLHGTSMDYGTFLDTKYTTRCGGNCRCGFAAGAVKGSAIEPLTNAEIQAALEA
jgi:hypothetical protein